jgi:hypothetical protein
MGVRMGQRTTNLRFKTSDSSKYEPLLNDFDNKKCGCDNTSGNITNIAASLSHPINFIIREHPSIFIKYLNQPRHRNEIITH